MLDKKVDFILVFDVNKANPNGDPLTGNMPRQDDDGFGEISDVCMKRKIRNRFQDLGENIFVKSNDRADDGFNSLQTRYEAKLGPNRKNMEDEEIMKTACDTWLDVRTFGQVLPFDNRAIGIRGPVSLMPTRSLEEVSIRSMQITKSVNGLKKDIGKKGSDTMGMKHFVDYGVYLLKGSVNAFFAEKTGFNQEDLEKLKEALRTIFCNDVSSARPEGSMNVRRLFWFEHSSKLGNTNTVNIHNLLKWEKRVEKEAKSYEDYNIYIDMEKLKEYEAKGLKFQEVEIE